ncbi:Protein N-acetyltransferase, RimJ/RimL family [Streptomyces sp. TLI_053]|uniref:GNAT family N-acetyltransferase n=1 Tax=Streptomyces sp. TLI_053 TaxID=1855352 RepID=UPI00087CBBE7|nr:Protein N-acetyltransferase, RimJ/RimL family [Streptomyces sp. TLI_053]
MTTPDESVHTRLDRLRRDRGLLTPAELLDLAEHGVAVLDPFSVIVSRRVELGPDNVLHPGVVVECDERSHCAVGPGNVLYGGTRISATDGGRITVGARSLIGDGGTRILAGAHESVRIGDEVRLMDGAEVLGDSLLGHGSQILGRISARSVELAAGLPYTHPDPDGRGGVIKGIGRAAGVLVGTGEVLHDIGHDLTETVPERQRLYHPEAPRLGPGPTLERLTAGHAGGVLAFERENREFFASSVPDRGDDYFTPDGFADRHRALLAEQAEGRCHFHVVLNGYGRIVGRVNLVDVADGSAELGYRVAEADSGQGVGRAAVEEVCRLAAAAYGLSALTAVSSLDNEASRALLTRTGFTEVGERRIDGEKVMRYRRTL